MKKRILSLLLVFVLIFSFVSCSNDENNNVGLQMNDGNNVVENNTNNTTDETPVVDEVQDNVVESAVAKYFAEMPEHIYKISQVEFVDMVKNGDDMFIIDMRSADDYANGHIKGAVNLTFSTNMSDNLQNIPTDKPVFIYCYTGQTAGQAVATLNIAGIPARSVNFGFNLGISKVEGVDAVLTTEATELVALGNDIDPELQAAMDTFYANLGSADENFKSNIVSEDNFKAMMDANEDYYLLSIRSAKDFEASHIKGAANLPFGTDMFAGFATLPKDKKVVVYCYSGQTAGQTVAALRVLGYDAVSLKGGMGVGANAPFGWTNKGFLTETPVSKAVEKYFAELPEHIYKIAQDEFVTKVMNNEDMFVIDMRSADDYAKGHIKGAVNIGFNTAMSDNLMNIPTDKEVFIYCYTGQTAGQAVATLNIAGIPARSVNFGFNLGISKVEGVDAVLTTEPTELVALGNDIDPNIQAAMDAYYAGLADVSETVFKSYKISEDNLKAFVDNKDETIYILSIRGEDAYKAGHIEGAALLPYAKDMQLGFDTLPTDKTIVVYCYTGQTAGQTVAALRLLGFDAVSLNGGMGTSANAPSGWANKGYPVVQ
ncbi:MAG: rhodanese-like domain-containing protein [Clostridia bacterium]|nr:rhodanese-like domain-containing protein [Clostridia bacterium]